MSDKVLSYALAILALAALVAAVVHYNDEALSVAWIGVCMGSLSLSYHFGAEA